MRGDIGAFFRIDGGDGDQDFFGRSIITQRVAEPWFGGSLPGWGEAFLLRVVGGPRIGEYVAITSRLTDSLSVQLARGQWISVVVHRVLQPGPDFSADLESVPAIGMAAIELL